MAKILISTRSSLGDVYPFLAIAKCLRTRGHIITFIINRQNLSVIEQENFPVFPCDQDYLNQNQTTQIITKSQLITGNLQGSLRLLNRLAWDLEYEFEQIHKLAPSYDLLIGSQTSLALPLVARSLKQPWIFAAPYPLAFFSLIDPPFTHGLRWLAEGLLPISIRNLTIKFLRFITNSSVPAYQHLEKRLGLPHLHPFLEGRYSPYGNLALFSSCLARPQADWPQPTYQCGFTNFYPKINQTDFKLNEFLDAGPSPLVFTLGSSARLDPRNFYRCAITISQVLGMRAVLIRRRSLLLPNLPKQIIACHFADYSSLFRYARLVIHHGGVGTLAAVLREGKPSVITPRALDQFDQAARAEQLGVARVLPFFRITTTRLLKTVRNVLENPCYTQTAQLLASQLCIEDGTTTAADLIESIILRKSKS